MGKHNYSMICRHASKETNLQECIVAGSLPNWLNGQILFNGPGLTKIGDVEYNHAFDSSAILQRFTIKKGKVYFCSKYLQSETFKKNSEAGKIMVAEFGTSIPTDQGLITRVISAIDSEKMFSDNAGLAVVCLGSRYYAIGKTPFFLEVDPETLDVINRVNLYKVCKLVTQSSHLMKDKKGNNYIFGGTYSMTGSKFAIVKFPENGEIEKAKTVATFPCRWRMSPSYIHSAVMTENYLIFIETPLVISLKDLLTEFVSNRSFFDGLKWHEGKKCLIRVVVIETWKEISANFVADAFFFLFFGNVYEENNHIVMDICAYKDNSFMKKMFIKTLREESNKESDGTFAQSFCPYLRRYVLPLNALSGIAENDNLVTLPNTTCKAVKNDSEIHLTHEVLCNIPFGTEPVRNPRFGSSGKSQFLFSFFGPNIHDRNYTNILKINMETRETLLFEEEDLYPTAPVFIANPDGKDEDDGLLLSMCGRSSDPSYLALLVLSAKTMTEVCRAHINLEVDATLPLHGLYIPE